MKDEKKVYYPINNTQNKVTFIFRLKGCFPDGKHNFANIYIGKKKKIEDMLLVDMDQLRLFLTGEKDKIKFYPAVSFSKNKSSSPCFNVSIFRSKHKIVLYIRSKNLTEIISNKEMLPIIEDLQERVSVY